MRKVILLLGAIAALFASFASADETKVTFTTLSGQRFENAIVSVYSPLEISVRTANGVTHVPFADLSPELRKQFGFDPSKLAAPTPSKKSDPVPGDVSQLAQKYRADIKELLRATPVSKITLSDSTREFFDGSRDLSLSMNQHASFIFAKWVQCIGLLVGSGLDDTGVDNVFRQQFTQEDLLRNTRRLAEARAIEQRLVRLDAPGAERMRRALDMLFSNYASVCELDTAPKSTNAADFSRDLRLRMECFTISLMVFSEEAKTFVDRSNALPGGK